MKGTLTEEGTVEFDFHDVKYREVKVYVRTKSATGKYTTGKQKTVAKGKGTGRSKSTPARTTGSAKAMAETERQSFNTSMGFSIPNIGVPAGGMAY